MFIFLALGKDEEIPQREMSSQCVSLDLVSVCAVSTVGPWSFGEFASPAALS